MKRLSMSVVAALTLLCGCQHDISGTYLATDKGAVCWLQLVRTPDDHLTGQMALSTLDTDGRVSQDAVPITGAINGENVTISISRWMGLQTVTFGGTFDDNKLTLTGGGEASPMVLKRTALNDYQKQLGELNARSQAILAAKIAADARERADLAQRNFVDQVDRLIGQMQRIDAAADLHLSRFPNIEKRYQALTAKMSAYVERERRLAGNPNAAADRSGLYVDANQASLDTNQLHLDVESLRQDFDTNAKPVADNEAAFENGCRNFHVEMSGLTSQQGLAHTAACGRLLEAAPLFGQKYGALGSGLARLEQVYGQEESKQQALLETAQKLE